MRGELYIYIRCELEEKRKRAVKRMKEREGVSGVGWGKWKRQVGGTKRGKSGKSG